MKLGYRPKEAAQCIGSQELFDAAVEAGWIKPVVQRHKLTLYDFTAVANLWERILAGEVPPARQRKTPRPTSTKKEVAHV
jgi:hypothetical protein